MTCPPNNRFIKKTGTCAPCAAGESVFRNKCVPPCDGLTPPGPGGKCFGPTTKITKRSFGTETEVSRFLPHDRFLFSSPNAITAPPRGTACAKISVEAVRKKDTKTQKRGERYFKQVPLPYSCPTGTKFLEASGRCSDGSEPTLNESCGSRGVPCGTVRQTCPVQFVFKRGEPHLRFCGAKGQRAPLVRVTDPVQAQDVARKACAAWEASTVRGADGKIETPGRYTAETYQAPLGRLRGRR